jgi:hypothetical protein
MGDMGDYFRDWKKHKKIAKAKRWQENERNIARLSLTHGFQYEIIDSSTGHALIEDRVDFWLSTGTWMLRGAKRRGHGFKQLIAFLKEK